MSNISYAAVDRLLEDTLLTSDPHPDRILRHNAEAGLPAIDVSPLQGAFLEMLCRLMGARRALEVGTLGGFSTLFLARGVGEAGRVVSLEIDSNAAATARKNLADAGVGDRVEIIEGPAVETLKRMSGEPAFDLAFIDADKASNCDYVRACLTLVRSGGLIIVDNVVRAGLILDPPSGDASTAGARAVLEMVRSEPRLRATALQTVGVKGWDGLAFFEVTG